MALRLISIADSHLTAEARGVQKLEPDEGRRGERERDAKKKTHAHTAVSHGGPAGRGMAPDAGSLVPAIVQFEKRERERERERQWDREPNMSYTHWTAHSIGWNWAATPLRWLLYGPSGRRPAHFWLPLHIFVSDTDGSGEHYFTRFHRNSSSSQRPAGVFLKIPVNYWETENTTSSRCLPEHSHATIKITPRKNNNIINCWQIFPLPIDTCFVYGSWRKRQQWSWWLSGGCHGHSVSLKEREREREREKTGAARFYLDSGIGKSRVHLGPLETVLAQPCLFFLWRIDIFILAYLTLLSDLFLSPAWASGQRSAPNPDRCRSGYRNGNGGRIEAAPPLRGPTPPSPAHRGRSVGGRLRRGNSGDIHQGFPAVLMAYSNSWL